LTGLTLPTNQAVAGPVTACPAVPGTPFAIDSHDFVLPAGHTLVIQTVRGPCHLTF
jgi:hypothetical protein